MIEQFCIYLHAIAGRNLILNEKNLIQLALFQDGDGNHVREAAQRMIQSGKVCNATDQLYTFRYCLNSSEHSHLSIISSNTPHYPSTNSKTLFLHPEGVIAAVKITAAVLACVTVANELMVSLLLQMQHF